MNGISALLAERSVGEMRLRFGSGGVVDYRESGASKLRIPRGSDEAILINTSGGMAGGDKIEISLAVEKNARLALSGQASERVYRSLGPPAEISCRFEVAKNAALHWLPQETILFEGSHFTRSIEAQLAVGSELLIVESFVLGRAAMGEVIAHSEITDNWNIHCDGKLIHAERFKLGPSLPRGPAGIAGAQVFATILLISPDIEARVPAITAAIAEIGAVSCWNGKLVARLAAEDGLKLKKALARAIAAATGGKGVPRVWAL